MPDTAATQSMAGAIVAGTTRTAGDRLGPYELVDRVGAGGMGEVWEARLHGPGGFRKAVAIKLLRPRLVEDRESREGLMREARLGALLHHPNVVGTLGLSEHDGIWVVALELVRGASTDELLRSIGPLPPRALIDVGAQAAVGLAHAHELVIDGEPAGLVHRDVKPANLLVDRTGFVKLADLGISLLAPEGGAVAGTPGYMAPEQAQGRAEARSDLFSLGATLFRLATRQQPFGKGPSALAAILRVESLLASASFLAPAEQAVPGLGEVLRRCLRANPEARYASARHLADALLALRPRQAAGPTLLETLSKARPGLAVDAPTETPVSDAATQVLPTGNLRPPRDRFVGREDELRALGERVVQGSDRLLAVLGPGGMGKTRLALEVARRTTRSLSGGAWAFDLSEARSLDGICATLAGALGLQLGRSDPVAQLGRVLTSKGPALVLLDNLEQCTTFLADTLGRWLDDAPEARFLCTSRMSLGLRGERAVHLGALTPADAVTLFLERASRPVRDDERAEAEALCGSLEGMPLAIELAAARVRLLGVAQVRSRLSLALLSGGGRDQPARQRSLEASLDWSAALLSPAARGALSQLAVFEGGFALDAAEAVLAGDGSALDVLQELVDACLLRVDPGSGRFAMLVVVRQYAELKGGTADRARAELRHGAWFAQLGAAESVGTLDLRGGRQRRRQLELELDNLVAACGRAVTRGDGRVALSTLRAAWAVIGLQGPMALAADLAVDMAALPFTGAERGRALDLVGQILLLANRPDEARAALDEALALLVGAGDERGESGALGTLGNLHLQQGRAAEARDCFERALALHRAHGQRRAEGVVLGNLGLLHHGQGRAALATTYFTEAMEAHREVQNRRGLGVALGALGLLLHEQGQSDEALAHLGRAVAIHREGGDQRYRGIMVGNIGLVHLEQGRMAQARACFEEALAIHREVGYRQWEGLTLGNLGVVHHAEGRPDLAFGHYEQALAIHRELEDRYEGMVLGNIAQLHDEQGRHDRARQLLDEALAVHRRVGNRRGEGTALGGLGQVLSHLGQLDEARARFEESLAIHREVGNRRSEGIVLGKLAVLAARTGRAEAIEPLLARGDALLREVDDMPELARLHCARAEIALLTDDPGSARAALAQAARLGRDRADIKTEVDRVQALIDDRALS